MLVLSSTIRIQQSAHDLGVVIDSRLSLSEHVASVCLTGCCQLRQAARCSSVDATHQDEGPGFHYQSPGLLQLTVSRHH